MSVQPDKMNVLHDPSSTFASGLNSIKLLSVQPNTLRNMLQDPSSTFASGLNSE